MPETQTVRRERRASKELHCSDPYRFIWCLGKIKAGTRYIAVLDARTGQLVMKLCDECSRRAA